MLFKSLWACIVGSEKAFGSKAIEHLAQIGRTRHDIIVSVERIQSEIVASAQLNPGLRHDLHQAESAPRRFGAHFPFAFDRDHAHDPTLRDRKSNRSLGHEAGICSGFG
ncbi:hypothetical protein A5906_23735 [Bradyrhizobium sacchari]|nr:hypothetical protein A5906_23735 [Bradyrhizobium sacchari]